MHMNQAQQQAVLHKDGPMLVLAGPGSGKTMVITKRTKYLIDQYQIPEEQILVITFTKAAAGEMKERFLRLHRFNRTGVSFGTFHAVFFTILKHAYHLNHTNIVGEDVRIQFLKEIIHHRKLEYEDEKEFISDIFSEISLVKGNRMEIANYYSTNCADDIFRGIYTDYNHKLRGAGLIDFDDMLLLSHQLLTEREDILKLWQNKFVYILIDEFQDINMVQYEIMKMLALPQNNLFIVGDDDQSIYRFRGAKPEIMLKFPEDYPTSKKVILNMNYRSAENIVLAANRLIVHNERRFPKEVSAAKEEGRKIEILNFENLLLEHQRLVEEIMKLRSGGISLSQMAILVRTTMGCGAMLHKLMEYNIAFQMKDNLPNLFDHWVVNDILTYIKIAMGSTQRALYLQVINRPKRYISRECFDTQEVDFEALKDYYEDKNWALERLDQLEYDLAILAGMNPFAAVNYIRKGIGYDQYLKEYAELRKIKTGELMELLDELQENARGYHTFMEWFDSMEEYKIELKNQMMGHGNKKEDCITIATMHSAKGLEYQAVFILDVNESIIPHKKAVLPEDLEEERRLFYVAITRAKEYLYLYSVRERYNKTLQSSRFIDEIDIKS